MSTLRTTEKKRSLSNVALPWKMQEFSTLPIRPGERHRSTETAEDDADYGHLRPDEFGNFRDSEG